MSIPTVQAPSRRRQTLALIGVVHIGMGVALGLRGIPEPDAGAAILYELLPGPLRIGLWLAAGLALIILALSPRTEGAGWFVAMCMPAERTISYAGSVLMIIIPGWPPGSPASAGALIIWGAITLIIWRISGWPEVDPLPASPTTHQAG